MSERRSPAPELQSVAAVSSPPIACNIEAIPAADRPRYRSLRDLVFQLVERLAMRTASRVITVCDSIGKALEQQYGRARTVAIIRNIPPTQLWIYRRAI